MATGQGQAELYSLVVVGSSAGGIEALSTLVATLPADFPAPLVLAQHLDPHHLSHLGEILARRSTLPVRTVVDREHLEPGVVYVIPADRHVEIADHLVRLLSDDGRGGQHPKPSVDRLFVSAARAYGERLIAVILTGTGSDGASGAHAVKAAGGMVVIENPATAAYPGMPASLAPTTVDLVVDLEQIGPLLHDLLTGAHTPTQPEAEEPLQALLAQVRQQSGIDFSRYKRPTILRRLQRRMVATGSSQLSDYTLHLAHHPEEYAQLIASFLISVTEFFRDASLFAVLRERVLPDLIADARMRGNVLRIWSAGCATGEEAYSLAILVAEALGAEIEQFSVQIFATDLDEEAVAFARRGLYSAASLASVPQLTRLRHFTARDGSYEIAPRIRGTVTFGQHDLGQRAPFPRIDLVLCRNVLIYFTPDLQRRVLLLFAFALRDGGYLALGKAESAQLLATHFASADERVKLYRRHGERVLLPIERIKLAGERPADDERAEQRRLAQRLARGGTASSEAHPAQVAASRSRSASEQLGQLLLDAAVGVIIVDEHYDIQTINSTAIRLLGIYSAAVGKDLVHLVHSLPAPALRATIDAAFHLAEESKQSPTVVTVETILGERRHLQIACYPHLRAEGTTEAQSGTPRVAKEVLILVSDVTRMVDEQQAEAQSVVVAEAERQLVVAHEPGDLERMLLAKIEENDRLRAHAAEVSAINRTLLQANQELVDANLDLRSANQELMVGWEEAEASAEEIKTLNEELQATNEELLTVNEEMEATVEELHTANEDLAARSSELQRLTASEAEQHQASEAARAQLAATLLSMGDALMVVDADGVVVLTNAAYAGMFGRADAVVLAEDAVGQPLPPAEQPQQRAAGETPFAMQFTLTALDDNRRWFEATGQPVMSESAPHRGVVTIRDITERRLRLLQEEFLALATHELRSPLSSLLMALQLLTKQSAADTDSPDMQVAIRLALRQGQRLRVLVNDLLDVGRVQQDMLHLDLAPVNLGDLLAETIATVRLGASGQTINLDPGNEPLVVTADAIRLEQIVLNLLTNAIKHAPSPQGVDVRLRRANGAAGGVAELQVQDYGPGISAADLPQVFTRYFQSAQAGSRAQGGSVWACSSPGSSLRPTVGASPPSQPSEKARLSPYDCHCTAQQIVSRLSTRG